MLKAWEPERVRIVENLSFSPMVLIPIGTRFSSILAVYRSASLAFYLEYHHSVAHVPALRVCSCQIDAKGKENVGQHHTYDKRCFLTATEKRYVISETIAGATGGDRQN